MISAQVMDNKGIAADQEKFMQLQAVLQRYCLSLTGSTWDAEDLVQDTWMKAMPTLQSRGHDNSEALLLRIAKNMWIDQSRRKQVLSRILKQEWERPKATLPDHGSFEIEASFQALLKHFSPLQRTVFLLREVFEFSIGETAEVLLTTEGAVKAALHRARHSLYAIQYELKKGGLSLPQKEEMRVYLQAMAAAYQIGDIESLIKLSQQDSLEAVAVEEISMSRQLFSNNLSTYSRTVGSKSQSIMMMAA